MNERIQQLESQCWEPRQYGPAWFNSKKFAELLILECANAANDWYQNHNDIHWDPSEHIKQHFGVEE